MQKTHESLICLLNSTDFIAIQDTFDQSLHNEALFLRNFINMYECILQFIRETHLVPASGKLKRNPLLYT